MTHDPVNLATARRHLSWSISSLDSRFRIFLLACLVATLSYLAAKLGGTLEILPQADWPLWPANVLVVAVLLLVPRSIWPIIITAAFASFVIHNLQAGLAIRSILWLTVSDTVEILIAAWGLRYFFDGVPQLNSAKALAKYSLIAGILAPSAGAIFGALAARGNYWTSWRISFFSEAIAYFTIMPAILGCMARVRSRQHASRAKYLEAIALVAAVISLSYFVFVSRWASTLPALTYFLVPFLLWSAVRFGSAGAGALAAIVAFVSVWGAAHGRGPFTETAPIYNVLWLQLFLLSSAVPFMVLAALVEEHQRDVLELRESEKRFRLLADSSPSLIWMSGTDKLCTFFNRGWLKFTGRPPEQEMGKGWLSGVHPDDRDHCLRLYSASFDARVDFELEYRLRRFDGEYRWLVDFGVPRFESDGTFLGYIGSCIDITDRKTSEESLRALTGRLISAQEEERARIARELHDDFSQRLALLGIQLGQLWKKLSPNEVEQRESVLEILRGTKEMSSDIHTLSHQLHSSKLEHVGLVPALNGLCKDFCHKYSIEVHFIECECPSHVSKDIALCLFRVAQEALGNVIKHSGTKEAQVELKTSADGLSLCISDQGKGFDPAVKNPAAGIGLIGMTERLRLVGGRLLVRSEPNHGAEILAEVPFAAPVKEVQVKSYAAGA